MASYCRLSSQVSTDAAPVMPRAQGSMSFNDMSYDAVARSRNRGGRGLGNIQSQPLQIPDNSKPTQSNRGQTGISSQKSNDTFECETMKKTEEQMKNISISFGSEVDSSYSSMELSSSLPSIAWEDDIKRYQDLMPLDLKIGYFDALILYAEEDRDAAEKFRLHLMHEIDIGPYDKVKAMLYDCPELTTLSGSQIGQLALAVERSTYVFMYLSKHFVKDKWMEFSSESCLMTAIYDVDKQWCVVPVYTEKRSKCTFKIPMGLNSLKGINYYNNDEFYKRGVARLIKDKVPLRKQMNERHKIKQKQWIENQKRKELELHEKQKRTELIEEGKTAQTIQWLADETNRLIREGIIHPEFHHSYSEGHFSTPNHSIPHIASTNSLKDIQSQNPHVAAYFRDLLSQSKDALNRYTPEQRAVITQFYVTPTTYNQGSYLPIREDPVHQSSPSRPSATLQRDNPVSTMNTRASTINNDASFVSFPLQSNNGIDYVQIPKALHDKIDSQTDEEKNMYVRLYVQEKQSSSVVSQYQHILTEKQLLHYGHGVPSDDILGSVGQPGNSLGNSGSPASLVEQPEATANHPVFSELLSRSYNHGEFDSKGPVPHSAQQQLFTSQSSSQYSDHNGNLPNSGLFQSLEDDGSSYRANSMTNDKASNMPQSMQSKPLQSPDKGRQTHENSEKSHETKPKKAQKTKREKNEIVHYTINVYNANAVQVGNQNMVTSVGNVETDGDDLTEDEIRKSKVRISEQVESKEPCHSTQVLKKDPSDPENDELVTRGEQPSQSSQGSCHLDAALSSSGSQPIVYSHTEQPETKGTKRTSIKEPENVTTFADQSTSNQRLGSVSPTNLCSTESLVTNQLPEGLKKMLFNEGNIEGSVSVEKSSLKDKVILDEVVQKEADSTKTKEAAELNRQDSRFKSDANPVVAVINPMRPKIPSDSGDCTEVKEVVPSEQTAVKVIATNTHLTNDRATNVNQVPAQVLTNSVNTETDQHTGYNNNSKNSTDGNLGSRTSEQREAFSTQRLTNARDLFYPNRMVNRGRVGPTPSRLEVSSSETFQVGSSEGFAPGTEPFSPHDMDLDYVKVDPDCFDDSFSRNREEYYRKRKQSANKTCVIS